MKAKELRKLSAIELEAKLRETREKLFRIRFRHHGSPLKNPLEIRNLRRDIARTFTIMNEIEQNKREEKK